jgi:RNA polymerase sigma-70 factor, ECF subfamily
MCLQKSTPPRLRRGPRRSPSPQRFEPPDGAPSPSRAASPGAEPRPAWFAEVGTRRAGNEAEWLTRLGAGESTAFAAVFSAHYERLCALARAYVKSPDTAAEIVAEVFVQIWEQRERLPVRDNLRGYLRVAVRNRALKHLKRSRLEVRWQREAARGARDDAMSQPPPPADEELLAAELQQALRTAIDALPARSREAYLLHRERHLSYAEIAAIMGVSARTVENHLARAVRILRERLAAWLG